MEEGIGSRFQRDTKYVRNRLPGGFLDWERKPRAYREYAQVEKVDLPAPDNTGGMPLWDGIGKRRSVQNFRNIAMSTAKLSQLLWASQEVTKVIGGYALHASHSAGALYPIETYASIERVEGMEPGIYSATIMK